MISQDEAIEILTSILASERSDILIGAGLDDVAVIRFGGQSLAITVDYTNFAPLGVQLQVSDLSDRGYLLMVHNVSDLIASGAEPLAAVVALAIPNSFTAEEIKQLGKGIRLAADQCGVAIVGGDTKEAQNLVMSATLLGRIGPAGCWTRAGAVVGDSIFVSGAIGGVSAAVVAIGKGLQNPEISTVSRQTLKRPLLPLRLASRLRAANIRLAAIDLSDGLGIDANRLADASNVGVEIYSDRLPLAPLVGLVAREVSLPAIRFAFGFGGDGQFLFTTDTKNDPIAIDAGATKIGIVTDTKDRVLVTPRARLKLPKFGHEDFTAGRSSDRLIHFLYNSVAFD